MARNLGMHGNEQMLSIKSMKGCCQLQWRLPLAEISIEPTSLSDFHENVVVFHRPCRDENA